MQPYQNLRVVAQARLVVRATYAFTGTLPVEERHDLGRQMRRAAVSVALNIAEGASRQTTREFVRYLEIARGSGMELHLAASLSSDLNFGDGSLRSSLERELESSQRQLSALITALRKRAAARSRH